MFNGFTLYSAVHNIERERDQTGTLRPSLTSHAHVQVSLSSLVTVYCRLICLLIIIYMQSAGAAVARHGDV